MDVNEYFKKFYTDSCERLIVPCGHTIPVSLVTFFIWFVQQDHHKTIRFQHYFYSGVYIDICKNGDDILINEITHSVFVHKKITNHSIIILNQIFNAHV